jgi:hypothetical protein
MGGTTNSSYPAVNKELSRKKILPWLPMAPQRSLCRDRANFAAANEHSIQSIRGTTREATMDIWRILLAISQVAAANQIQFDKVESVPMARFHSIGQVFPEALYGHIIIKFDVAVLRGQIKDLQEGISYRRERATPKHRDLYDVLEEKLVAGNQELEGNMTFFTTSERKERTFGEWIAGVLGLWNVVQIHKVKKMFEGTKKGFNDRSTSRRRTQRLRIGHAGQPGQVGEEDR